MSKPIFAYNNILTTGTVTATSENASFPVSNLTNWKPSRWYKSGLTGAQYINIDASELVDVDYFGVFSHDLTEKSATVKLQWSDDGITGWTDLTTSLSKSDSEVIFKTFTSVNKRYFRIEVDSPSEICSLGIVSIGQYLEIERGLSSGFIPPHLNTTNKNLVNIADGGLPLGSSIIRNEAKLEASISQLSSSWVRNNWIDLLAHSEVNPLFFSWNNDVYPDEAVFIMLDNTKTTTTQSSKNLMSLKISGKAWHKL